MSERLAGKVVVVTGGTKGIGRGVAIAAAREGASVVIGGRNEREGDAAAAEIAAAGGRGSLFVSGDLGNGEACRELVGRALDAFGRIDGFVNNAGWFPRATLLETDEELYDRVFEANAKSAFFCSKYAIEAMMRTGGGSIVHMGSTHGYRGIEDLAAYGSAKGAMHTLSRHIAWHYAKHRIRSNWITVGWVATEGEIGRVGKDGLGADDLEAEGRLLVPSGRLQTAEDMAYGVIYLLSDESTQVNGTDLHITGGFNLP